MSNLRPPPVYKVIVAQVVATVFIAAIFLLVSSTVTAYSILVGGLISAIPNCYFTFHAFRFQGARNTGKVVQSFIKGELGKIAITILLFALSFSLITNLNELALILTFVGTQFLGVVISGLIDYRPSSHKT